MEQFESEEQDFKGDMEMNCFCEAVVVTGVMCWGGVFVGYVKGQVKGCKKK